MADQPRMQGEKALKNTHQDSSDMALKSEVEVEIRNIKQCSYNVYECTQFTMQGYEYCLRHILSDKNSPYKQCTYIYNNGKRCHMPAPKDKKDSGYCSEHALKNNLQNWRQSTVSQPPRTSEMLLHSLSHYIKKPRSRTISASTLCSDEDHNASEECGNVVTKSLDPFVHIDAKAVLASSSQILDMCSDSESDVDATSFGSIWHDVHAESSDNDSIDSEQEDVLKHANVYSAEEITLIARDKLIRLQSLYVDQYRYLQHMLRERRRRYLYALRREKDAHCSIANQMHESPKEQRLYKKLKAYNSYHRKHGIEAICSKKLYEQKLKVTEGMTPKTHSFAKCVFTEGGVKCGERALPVTRHCRKHILEDSNQILFRACSKMQGDIECTTPVEAIFENTTCRLHMDIPEIRSYANTRKDSESDYDESLEAPPNLNIPLLKVEIKDIKSEPLFDTRSVLSSYPTIKQEENIFENEHSSYIFKTDSEIFPKISSNNLECDTENIINENLEFEDIASTNLQLIETNSNPMSEMKLKEETETINNLHSNHETNNVSVNEGFPSIE